MIGEIEAQIPYAMQKLAYMLMVGVPYIEALESISKGYGAFSEEIKGVLRKIKAGSSVQDALRELSEKWESQVLKRAVLQMISAYELQSYEPLKEVARDIFSSQRSEIREFYRRFSLYLSLFLAFSTLFPSLFITFSSLAPHALRVSLPQFLIPFFLLLVFPSLNLLFFMLMKRRAPRFLR